MTEARYGALADRIARRHGIDPALFRQVAFPRPTGTPPRAPGMAAPRPLGGGAEPFDELLRIVSPAHIAHARRVLTPAGMVPLGTTSTHEIIADWVTRETGGRGNDNLYRRPPKGPARLTGAQADLG